MALLLLLVLHLIQAVHPQYLSQPWVVITPDADFEETESLTLDCAASVLKYQCYFYPEGDETKVKLSPTCQLSLTVPELINWTKHRSTGPINIICYYVNSDMKPSPHSAPALIEYLSQPWVVTTYDADLKGTESVTLRCAASGFKYQCYFYPEGDETKVKLSSTCQLSLTISDLINWTNHRSAGPINIICYYANSDLKPSLHSAPVPVFIEYIKPTLSVQYDDEYDDLIVICEIPAPDSVSDDFRCFLYTGEDQQHFQKAPSQRTTSGGVACTFTVQKNVLIKHLQSARSHELSCDYKLKTKPTKNSPRSEKYNMINVLPVLTQPPLTEQSSTAASPFSSTHQITERGKATISTTHLITKRGPTTTPFPATTKPSSTKEISTAGGPTTNLPQTDKEHSTAVSSMATKTEVTTNQHMSTDAPKRFIMLSVTGVGAFLSVAMSCCLCRFIWKQRTERRRLNLTHGNHGPERKEEEKLKKAEDDVYHLYCTIPDVPTNQQDNTYSLVQLH